MPTSGTSLFETTLIWTGSQTRSARRDQRKVRALAEELLRIAPPDRWRTTGLRERSVLTVSLPLTHSNHRCRGCRWDRSSAARRHRNRLALLRAAFVAVPDMVLSYSLFTVRCRYSKEVPQLRSAMLCDVSHRPARRPRGIAACSKRGCIGSGCRIRSRVGQAGNLHLLFGCRGNRGHLPNPPEATPNVATTACPSDISIGEAGDISIGDLAERQRSDLSAQPWPSERLFLTNRFGTLMGDNATGGPT
jgi:hypothetical protein